MPPILIAFIVGLSSGVWVYYKFAKRTGSGNLKPAAIGGAVVGLMLFIISLIILSMILK